ncbi:MAG: ERF family protein [Clostridia bacterium]|nr:ERF family protein [Clostridia bacterium]MBQ5757810.1 ERF family protein [Clostridia bacterium]
MFPNLASIQKQLKVCKTRSDTKGRYVFRTLDDILIQLKPLIPEGCLLILSDTVVEVAGAAFVVSTATWHEGEKSISTNGCSQIGTIAENKGMSSPQHTGSASSYARKGALCAMFLLDNGDDPDEINPAQMVPPPMPGAYTPPMPGAYTPPMPGAPQILYKN